MKKTFIIANWKLYLDNQETLSLVESLVQSEIEIPANTEVVICPMHTILGSVENIYTSKIKLGAQDVFWENKGAFTGEVSAEGLKDLGCEYVIVGHSERREHLGETSEMVSRKVRVALKQDLIPILCVGEKHEVREANMTEEKVRKQLHGSLSGVSLDKGFLIVAYEPVWAIYPSKYEVNPDDVEAAAVFIEKELIKLFGEDIVYEKCTVIYGGSVDASSIGQFLSLSHINGALIGHASTNYAEFVKIVQQASGTKS